MTSESCWYCDQPQDGGRGRHGRGQDAGPPEGSCNGVIHMCNWTGTPVTLASPGTDNLRVRDFRRLSLSWQRERDRMELLPLWQPGSRGKGDLLMDLPFSSSFQAVW